VVVEDHPLFRDGLRLLLNEEPGLEVVGMAATGEEGIVAVADLQPDVVVMDLQLPDVHGLEVTRRILASSPHVQVLVLTMFDDDDLVFAAMRAGARGYLLKGSHQSDIVRAVEAVSRGDAIFGPGVANRLLGFFAARQAAHHHEAFPELTPREREVLDLIAQGLSNDAIARRLLVSAKTVRNHISNVFTKLAVTDRSEAIVRARRAGLGDGPGG
jgi:DNA-binding NarL/FixJ family response regulator